MLDFLHQPAIGPLLGVLVGGLISTYTSFMILRRQQRHEDARSERAGFERLIVDVLTHSLTLMHFSNGSRSIVASVQSLGTRRDMRRGILRPIDLQRLSDDQTAIGKDLGEAAARVWVTGDRDMIELTNAITYAAARVMEAQMAGPANFAQRVERTFKRYLVATRPGNEQEINARLQELGKARKALADYARQKHGLDDLDLFALPVTGQA